MQHINVLCCMYSIEHCLGQVVTFFISGIKFDDCLDNENSGSGQSYISRLALKLFSCKSRLPNYCFRDYRICLSEAEITDIQTVKCSVDKHQ